MEALIDGDIVAYRVGFTTEAEPTEIARFRVEDMIDGILVNTRATDFKIWFSDSAENNYRYKIDPTYKANRVAPKPKHLDFIKEYLIQNFGARIAHGMEADDALGIAQNKEEFTTVICSIDKDLKMIPGYHYNFVKNEFSTVTEEEGFLSFYRSILVGDVADNIKGVYGIGPKKAEKILPSFISHDDSVRKILSAYMVWLYTNKFGKIKDPNVQLIYPGLEEEAGDLIRKNAQLLKIKQDEEEPLWDSPVLKPMVGQMRLFTVLPEVELSLSTALTIPEIKNLAGSRVLGEVPENS